MITSLAQKVRITTGDDCAWFTDDAAKVIIAALREHLQTHPDDIEKILPGFRLVPKKLSRSERSARTLPAMNAARRIRRNNHIQSVAPHINEILKLDPAISRRELGRQLDKAGIKPPRGRNWSVSSLTLILKELQK